MTWVLKTRAVTGKLVPLGGTHLEYKEWHDAWRAARHYTEWFLVPVYVEVFATGAPAENTEHLVERYTADARRDGRDV